MMSETGTYRDKRRENATELAISGLAFLAADPERLERFLSLTGLDPGSIRSAAQEPGFLGGVIRHIMEDDRIAAAFAAEEGLSAEELTAAAAALGGHWERETP
jgi:hypothetical protein